MTLFETTYGAVQPDLFSPHKVRRLTVPPTSLLLDVIDHNAATKPKPYHMNRDLMTTALKLEAMQ